MDDAPNNPLQKYVTKKDPKEMIEALKNMKDQGSGENIDELTVTNSIPIQKFKSNHLSKKEKFISSNEAGNDLQLSPTAASALRDVNFKNIDHPSMLSAIGGTKF